MPSTDHPFYSRSKGQISRSMWVRTLLSASPVVKVMISTFVSSSSSSSSNDSSRIRITDAWCNSRLKNYYWHKIWFHYYIICHSQLSEIPVWICYRKHHRRLASNIFVSSLHSHNRVVYTLTIVQSPDSSVWWELHWWHRWLAVQRDVSLMTEDICTYTWVGVKLCIPTRLLSALLPVNLLSPAVMKLEPATSIKRHTTGRARICSLQSIRWLR